MTKFTKYNSYPQVELIKRTWPHKVIKSSPIWCPVDLRDGNQALAEPMDSVRKMKFFKKLVEVGYKEIEVGFPSASETDFNFIRKLILENHIQKILLMKILFQNLLLTCLIIGLMMRFLLKVILNQMQ